MSDGYSGAWNCRKLQLSLLCPDAGKKISVFGESHVDETAKELDIPVIGKMPIDAGLAEAVEEERFYEISNDYLTDAVNKL